MLKKIITGTVAGAVLLSGASLAYAEDATTTVSATPATSTAPAAPVRAEMQLSITRGGHVFIRGTVDSVGTDYVMVKSYGGSWKVMVSDKTEVLPKVASGAIDLSKFTVGDYVGAIGAVSLSEDWTINARILRDHTEGKALMSDRKENRKTERALRRHAESTVARVTVGTVGDISGASFTITTASGAITADTGNTTKFVNRKWNTIAFGDIKSGDKIRVYGVVASSTSAAQVVRDLSIPR